jgi:hypothetical protein
LILIIVDKWIGKGIPKEREVDRRREIGEWEG